MGYNLLLLFPTNFYKDGFSLRNKHVTFQQYNKNIYLLLISVMVGMQINSPIMTDGFIEPFFESLNQYTPQILDSVCIVILLLSPLVFIFNFLENKFGIKKIMISSSFISGIIYILLEFFPTKNFAFFSYFALMSVVLGGLIPINIKLAYFSVDNEKKGFFIGLSEAVRIISGYVFFQIFDYFFSNTIIVYGIVFIIFSVLFTIFLPNEYPDNTNSQKENQDMSWLNTNCYIILVISAFLVTAFTVSLLYCLGMFGNNIQIFFHAGTDLSSNLETLSKYITPIMASIFGGIFWDSTSTRAKQTLLLSFIAFIAALTIVLLFLPINSSLLPIVLITNSLLSIAVYSMKIFTVLLSFIYTLPSKRINFIISAQLFALVWSSVLVPLFLTFVNDSFDPQTSYKLTYQLMVIFSILCYICIILSSRFIIYRKSLEVENDVEVDSNKAEQAIPETIYK